MFTEIKKADKEFRKHITVIRSELDNEAEAKRPYPHSENEGVHKHVNSKCFYPPLSTLSNQYVGVLRTSLRHNYSLEDQVDSTSCLMTQHNMRSGASRFQGQPIHRIQKNLRKNDDNTQSKQTSEIKDTRLLGHDAVQIGIKVETFQSNFLPPPSGYSKTLPS